MVLINTSHNNVCQNSNRPKKLRLSIANIFIVTIIPPDIQNLNVEQIDFNNHEFLKNLIKLLLNVIESQLQTIEELKKENQSLKDEINRLKGEKGKPKISPNVPEKKEDIQSSSIEKKKNWSKAAKKTHHKDGSDRNKIC